ncbi:MAG: CopD family protein [Rhodoferax sp.]|nr:CopD family protein [Rhodoferax sp.]HRA61547.1 CopD family protein [Burkholderiaceae bacterium]
MLYAVLKTLHLLSIILWIGGMAFVLFFLRPALGSLQPPVRVTLMHDVLRRFFGAVSASIIIVLVSGLWMMGQFARGSAAASGVHMPMSWMVMATLGLLMMAIFGHIRFVLYKRLQRAVAASDWPAGGAALGSIRAWVLANLAIGLVIILVLMLL